MYITNSHYCGVFIYDPEKGWIENNRGADGDKTREYQEDYIPQPELQIIEIEPSSEMDIPPFSNSELENIIKDVVPKKKNLLN